MEYPVRLLSWDLQLHSLPSRPRLLCNVLSFAKVEKTHRGKGGHFLPYILKSEEAEGSEYSWKPPEASRTIEGISSLNEQRTTWISPALCQNLCSFAEAP